jgi:hypothetical protein
VIFLLDGAGAVVDGEGKGEQVMSWEFELGREGGSLTGED